jgi:hypothetical protein
MKHYRGYKQRSVSRRYQHMVGKHGGHKQREFNCPVCLFSSKSSEEFKTHWKAKHDNSHDRNWAHKLGIVDHIFAQQRRR